MLKDPDNPEDKAPASQNPCPQRLGSWTLIYSRGTEASLVGTGQCLIYLPFITQKIICPACHRDADRDVACISRGAPEDKIVLCLIWFYILMRWALYCQPLPVWESLSHANLSRPAPIRNGDWRTHLRGISPTQSF